MSLYPVESIYDQIIEVQLRPEINLLPAVWLPLNIHKICMYFGQRSLWWDENVTCLKYVARHLVRVPTIVCLKKGKMSCTTGPTHEY